MVQNGGDFDLDIDMATDVTAEQLLTQLARIKELENREKYSQKLVNEAYAKIEALEGAKAKRIKIELPGKYGGTKEDLAGFLINLRSYFRLNDDKFPDDKAKVLYIATRLEGKVLRWFEPTWNDYLTEEDEDDRDTFTLANLRQTKLAASYAEKVKDELYKYDRPETLDEYIAQAIRIDDRLYAREQQKRGRMNGTTVKANDKKKRAYVSTSYGTHPGAMDMDAAQKQDQKKTTKDKSNEITAIDETTKDVIEVAATSYEDKGSDIDSLGHDGNGKDEQAPNSELVTVDPETGLAEWDMAGEYAPLASILPALGQWGFTVT
ncbi:hypothetical protein MYCTH_2128489 [Thermothelomyces thermophilus ATCC 42464]|uniref:DUF4939 domain-containing protein n=1 Tax=Thermothelomyces thermophilus (strain ATCC 42464 / BCRC 31852 / DSM 1799) TaxID=573729 RepID=G2QGS4_THET4|nr:uncharacterized protein MYCTH_2128489 [Thermothelomyces thermophilus ATCC 42464]AEO59431.1 hypothetical protein MYCTH_2128489 [Thermothelomyces thermophilus ATCC 42464]